MQASRPRRPARPAAAMTMTMTMSDTLRTVGLLAALVVAAFPAQALYKVVGPDGRVTYTDRPPAGASAQQLAPSVAGAGRGRSADAALPLELRQAAARYPVTLYVVASCPPCDSARALLRGRGIPYTEKIVVNNEDSDALQRLTGTRDAPTLTVGTQPLRGFSADVWNFYLDSAGYPRESRLPAGWQYAPAVPVVERREALPGIGAAASSAADGGRQPLPGAAVLPGAAPAPPASGIRF